MGYNLANIPESFRRRMASETRRALGPLATTAAESQAKADLVAEKEMHRQFEQWLRLNNVAFVHSRMDRKPTIAEGWPDFTLLWQNRCLCIEFKAKGGQLSKEQRECIDSLFQKSGVTTLVCYSLTEAMDAVKELLL